MLPSSSCFGSAGFCVRASASSARRAVSETPPPCDPVDAQWVCGQRTPEDLVALPGGIGTLEELYEVWTWRQLGYHHKSLGLLNTNGYYDDLLRFIDRSRESGFLWPDVQQLLMVDTTASTLLDRLHHEALALQKQTPPDSATASPGGVTPDI